MMDTEDDYPICGATSWVAKCGSISDTGKIGRCQPDGTEHILGTSRALHLSAETTDEVSVGDDSSGMNGNKARGSLRTGRSSSDVRCVVLRGSGAG